MRLETGNHQSLPMRLENVSVALGRGRDRRVVIHGQSLCVSTGEFVVLVGPNGAGKTTLLKAMAGLVPARGCIFVGSSNLAAMRPRERSRIVSYLPQEGRIHWPLPVRDVVALGRLPFGASAGSLSTTDRAIVIRSLEQCCIDHLADRPATALSAGEKARVLLARAIAVGAPILLADEPAASLDPAHQVAIMALLQRQAAGGHTVVAILHDLSLAARYATRIVALDAGRIAADGPAAEIVAGVALDQVFGVRLLRAEVEGSLIIAPAGAAGA